MALSFEESINAMNENESVATDEQVDVQQTESSAVATDSSRDEWLALERYNHYDNYKSTYRFTLDIDKTVNVSKKKITITKESNARFFSFEMPRYSDGYDLTSFPTIQFYYVNAKGTSGRSVAVNVSCSTDAIRFGWLLDAAVTAVPGKLMFEVQVLGTTEEGKPYVWRSVPCDVLYVAESLSSDEEVVPDEDWTGAFLAKVGAKVEEANETVDDAKDLLQTAAATVADADKKIAEVYLAIDETKKELSDGVKSTVASTVGDALKGYYDASQVYSREEVDSAIAATGIDDKIWELRTAVAYLDDSIQRVSDNQKEIGCYHEAVDEFISMLNDDYVKSDDFEVVQNMASDSNTQIAELNRQVAQLASAVESIKKTIGTTYSIVEDESDKCVFTLYKNVDDIKTPMTKFVLGESRSTTLSSAIDESSDATNIEASRCSLESIEEALGEAADIRTCNVTDIDWILEDTEVLDRIYGVKSSVVTGTVYVPVITQSQMYLFGKAWPKLEIEYDTIIEQNPVTFVNWNGDVLDVQYVEKGKSAVDPTSKDKPAIETPVRESDAQYSYVFNGWDTEFDNITAPLLVKATYTETQRTYNVKYVSKGVVMQESTARYGEVVNYTGPIPTYTVEEGDGVYYLFDHWDKSGYVDGDKVINAVYSCCGKTSNWPTGKALQDMSPVEVYAITQSETDLSSVGIEVNDDIDIRLGYDVDYEDVSSMTFIDGRTLFTGTNYYVSETKLFDEDRDFVFAIEAELSENVNPQAVLVRCCGKKGFEINAYTGKLEWCGDVLDEPVFTNERSVTVLRHRKGQRGVTVYRSTESEPMIADVKSRVCIDDAATLTFGVGTYDNAGLSNYSKGVIYWSKLWYGDLGDVECRRIASHTHETLSMVVADLNTYAIAGRPTKRAAMTMLSANPIDISLQYDAVAKSRVEWKHTTLDEYLNGNLYDALPVQYKQIVKRVTVDGGEDRIFIPSASEMSNDISYKNNKTTTFPCMINGSSRVLHDDDGTPTCYWLRNSDDTLPYLVTENGKIEASMPSCKARVRVEFCF